MTEQLTHTHTHMLRQDLQGKQPHMRPGKEGKPRVREVSKGGHQEQRSLRWERVAYL